MQISMECETQENTWIYTKPKMFMCRYRVNQQLIALNLYSVSINKILAMEFITVKVLQNLNLM